MQYSTATNIDIASLVSNIKFKFKKSRTWIYRCNDSTIKLIADIVTLWSLINMQKAEYIKNNRLRDEYCLYRLNVSQIIAILRLLNVDKDRNGIENNIVEINKLEGKSLIWD